MAKIDIPDTALKGVREALCAAQSGLNRSGMGSSLLPAQNAHIQDLIRQIDELRPLDADGKHRIHTAHCGCEESGIKICKYCEREIVQLNGPVPEYTYWTHTHSGLTRCWQFLPSKDAEPVLELTT